jgi:hypothetical protein
VRGGALEHDATQPAVREQQADLAVLVALDVALEGVEPGGLDPGAVGLDGGPVVDERVVVDGDGERALAGLDLEGALAGLLPEAAHLGAGRARALAGSVVGGLLVPASGGVPVAVRGPAVRGVPVVGPVGGGVPVGRVGVPLVGRRRAVAGRGRVVPVLVEGLARGEAAGGPRERGDRDKRQASPVHLPYRRGAGA